MIHTSGRDVAMTPTGEVTWKAAELGDGTLYLPAHDASADERTAEVLLSGLTGELLSTPGKAAQAYAPEEHPDLIIKEFSSSLPDERIGGLPTIRANVMLAAGLETLRQRHAWRIQGCEVLGALVLNTSDDPADHRILRARWLMARVKTLPGIDTADYMSWIVQDAERGTQFHTKPSKKPALPSVRERGDLYAEALEAVSGGLKIFYDLTAKFDDHPGNLLIERLPEKRGLRTKTQGMATKLDVTASEGFSF